MPNAFPPIPPNCPYFVESPHHGVIFSISSPGFKTIGLYVDESHGYPAWRQVIAAVAEVAWLAQDDMWHQEHLDTCDPRAESGIMQKRDECHRNAAAWRLWGTGEWKP